jgi:hypothetical protein
MYRVVFDNYYRSSNLQKAAALLHDLQQAGQVPNFEMHWSIISNFSSTNEKTEGHGEPIVTEPPNYTKLSKKIHLPGQRI